MDISMSKIKIALAGLGNCPCSLIQGLEYYKSKKQDNFVGLMHWESNLVEEVLCRQKSPKIFTFTHRKP